MQKKYYGGLDLLKFVATIILVLCHCQQSFDIKFEHGINFIKGRFNFQLIVELFFIISGFLITKYIYKIKSSNNRLKFSDFFLPKYLFYYINIIISILSLLIITLACYFKNGIWLGPKIRLFDLLISFVGLQNIGIYDNPGYNNPVWYVSVLVICLVLFYFICFVSSNLNINENYFFVIMIFIGLYIRKQKINYFILNETLYRGYVAFFIGAILHNILDYMNNKEHLKYCKYHLIKLIQIITLILILLLTIFDNDTKIINQYYVYTFVFSPILVILFVNNTYFSYNNSFIKLLGNTVFPMYIFHLSWIRIIFNFLGFNKSYLTMIIIVISCFIFSIFYQHFISSKIKLFVKKITSKTTENNNCNLID